MTLVYIHGANATSASFNYISSQIGAGIMLDYDSQTGFETNLQRMSSQLARTKDITFVAHSLGGVYALHLAQQLKDRVARGITLSTPYGGYAMADLAKLMIPWHQLFHDIGPDSWPIKTANRFRLLHPWCNLVTTKGHVPWVHGDNDGVVTIDSQRYRSDMELIDVACNHYEILLSPMSITAIKQRLVQ
jgi:triacylglycerol esterase/lipase EstA (alpha/beta hydrolase family)